MTIDINSSWQTISSASIAEQLAELARVTKQGNLPITTFSEPVIVGRRLRAEIEAHLDWLNTFPQRAPKDDAEKRRAIRWCKARLVACDRVIYEAKLLRRSKDKSLRALGQSVRARFRVDAASLHWVMARLRGKYPSLHQVGRRCAVIERQLFGYRIWDGPQWIGVICGVPERLAMAIAHFEDGAKMPVDSSAKRR